MGVDRSAFKNVETSASNMSVSERPKKKEAGICICR